MRLTSLAGTAAGSADAAAAFSNVVGGLRLAPAEWRKAAPDIVLSTLGVTALIVLLDCFLFRAILPASYVAFFTGPNLVARIVVMTAMSGIDEVEYRLALMTTLAVVGGLIWRDADGRVHPAVFVAAIMLTQAIYVLLKLPAAHGGAEIVYDALRYFLVGSVWGWLYWRHGWLSAVAGHAGTHMVLQPALLLLLS